MHKLITKPNVQLVLAFGHYQLILRTIGKPSLHTWKGCLTLGFSLEFYPRYIPNTHQK